jgi:heavy metal sensor kinase
MSLPIRVRLTAWSVLVLTVVLVALGAFVVIRLRESLTSELDRSLSLAAAQIAYGYRTEGVKNFHDVARTVLPAPGTRGSGTQLLSPAGRVLLADGDTITSRPLVDLATVRGALRGQTVSRSGSRPATGSVRTVAVPVTRRGVPGVVVVSASLETVDRSVHRVLVLLVIGGVGALVLVAVGGWWLARKALAPVERITARAERIDAEDLSERLTVPRARDELGHLARTLNAMLDRVEEGVHARERLVADASHELRAPLAAMRAELDVSLRHDDLDAAARRVLESTRDEAVRMSRAVDGLLLLARVDAGRLELARERVDLRAIAEAGAGGHREAARKAGVSVVVTGEPVTVLGDGNRLLQLVGNLVDNAVRYAPLGSEVGVEVWHDGADAGVTVSDDGPGVPEQLRERVFERFARADPARRRQAGAGLGLAICREVARAHGGRIWIDAHRRQGSAFVFVLPATSPRSS